MAQWDLTDSSVYPWRSDEELQNGPMVCYDEKGPKAPSANYNPVMPNYATAQVGGNWVDMGWLDPDSFVWVYGTAAAIAAGNYSFTQPSGFTGGAPGPTTAGAQIISGLYSGSIISHNAAGSDPHFWFGAIQYQRTVSGGAASWAPHYHGQLSAAPIPTASLRWPSALESQYDAQLSAPLPGYWPGSFLHEQGGVLVGCKYIQATQSWPATNYSLSSKWTITLDCSGAVDTSAQPAPAASQRTGVFAQWQFNQRGQQSGYSPTPTWYGAALGSPIPGCISIEVDQFTYGSSGCRAVVGFVPFYSPSPTPGSSPVGGSRPPVSAPVEHFPSQVMDQMPDGLLFDDAFGAHWQGVVYLTMDDPLYTNPTIPTCSGKTWKIDDGCSQPNDTTDSPEIFYYPATPLVEAACVIPAGSALPSGYLPLDPAHNVLSPPYYPNGIPIPDGEGGNDFNSVVTDWGFAGLVCAGYDGGGRFSGFYSKFVTCTNVVRQSC